MYYLLKTEPDVYSFSDLQRDGATIWDGITNAAAVKHLREMKAGDRLVIYHTGDERQAVGSAIVKEVKVDDPKHPQVTIEGRSTLDIPRTLADMKQQAQFADSPLVRQGRLSVVPLNKEQYEWIVKR